MSDNLKIGNMEFTNRLFTGTGKFSSRSIIPDMLKASGSEMITVALRRVDFEAGSENILEFIPKNVIILPNTSGARTCDEAVRIARIAREAGLGDFIKIEIITDTKYLMPDNEETLKATKILSAEGFIVLPYIMPDLTYSYKLVDAGASAVMPLGSPIGSNRGIKLKEIIEMIIENIEIPVIVDAGIGRPSHAAEAMEMGADAVLVNTAISVAKDPVTMGRAFSMAVQAGRMAYLAKIGEETRTANASSPLTGFLR
ncbi:MAG: thiazole synthase [Candidatus Delongbacteria bacterium]|nr:thiazole synthase [Candidatus Delongbacteria bacterium]MCG2761544.1 thiazole synthase [Candidatus Delongbacteria bacterium]